MIWHCPHYNLAHIWDLLASWGLFLWPLSWSLWKTTLLSETGKNDVGWGRWRYMLVVANNNSKTLNSSAKVVRYHKPNKLALHTHSIITSKVYGTETLVFVEPLVGVKPKDCGSHMWCFMLLLFKLKNSSCWVSLTWVQILVSIQLLSCMHCADLPLIQMKIAQFI